MCSCLFPSSLPFLAFWNKVRRIAQSRITPLPPWWPVAISQASLVVVVGHKGDHGILFYPSKGGFVPDRRGIPWDLLAISWKHQMVDPPSPLYATQRCVEYSTSVTILIIGDSIIRHVRGPGGVTPRNMVILSIAGATIQSLQRQFELQIPSVRPRLVVVHVGTNNVNKDQTPSELRVAVTTPGGLP